METADKRALLESSLERAAEEIGDITKPVMDLYYQRFPNSREAFERLWPGRRDTLEGEMTERTLYCLMQWFDSPGEIEIMLMGSVPHHNATLQVRPEWFAGFIDATADVITATIPADRGDEQAVWQELRAELQELVDQSAGY